MLRGATYTIGPLPFSRLTQIWHGKDEIMRLQSGQRDSSTISSAGLSLISVESSESRSAQVFSSSCMVRVRCAAGICRWLVDCTCLVIVIGMSDPLVSRRECSRPQVIVQEACQTAAADNGVRMSLCLGN